MPRTVLLVPVKAWPRAKSRLRVEGVEASALAAAFAADALAAALAATEVSEVVVVTDAEAFSVEGVRVLADRGDGDLNRALSIAAEEIVAHRPGRAVAAMCADLPCLRSEDLDAAVAGAAGRRAFLADADGTGTTLLMAAPHTPLDPRFGVGSAARHRASGALALDLPLASLRRDVDTDGDLAAALTLGVGPRTAAVLDAAAVGGASHPR
ncbi:MAG: 2-phospho-L-lactate guanylyltransferase [Marmoricola sp.]